MQYSCFYFENSKVRLIGEKQTGLGLFKIKNWCLFVLLNDRIQFGKSGEHRRKV